MKPPGSPEAPFLGRMGLIARPLYSGRAIGLELVLFRELGKR